MSVIHIRNPSLLQSHLQRILRGYVCCLVFWGLRVHPVSVLLPSFTYQLHLIRLLILAHTTFVAWYSSLWPRVPCGVWAANGLLGHNGVTDEELHEVPNAYATILLSHALGLLGAQLSEAA